MISTMIGTMCEWLITNLRRVDVKILERIESDENVTNISVNLQLIISLLEMADYCLLRKRKKNAHKHIASTILSLGPINAE